MSTTLKSVEELPKELHNGDSMTRDVFHRIYSTMPEDVKAELIEGIVYMASPLKYPHSRHHIILGTLFGTYEAHTLGVEAADNASIFLGEDSEPQPDLVLRITAESGGQSHINEKQNVVDAPELFAEIADSSHSLDLHGNDGTTRSTAARSIWWLTFVATKSAGSIWRIPRNMPNRPIASSGWLRCQDSGLMGVQCSRKTWRTQWRLCSAGWRRPNTTSSCNGPLAKSRSYLKKGSDRSDPLEALLHPGKN